MPPKGGERATNHYVNLNVFQKIVHNDVEGLEPDKPLVVSKDSAEELLSPVTPDTSFEGEGAELRVRRALMFVTPRVFQSKKMGGGTNQQKSLKIARK